MTILYFNDWHGHLEPFARDDGEAEVMVGGAAHLARVLGERRAASPDALLMVAGDILQGTPMSTVFRGRPDFELLQRFGVDAMSLGNHEFDFGRQVLEERIEQVDFPILAANVRDRDGDLWLDAWALLETAKGVRVAVLGLVTDDTPRISARVSEEGLSFDDPVVAAEAVIPTLPEHDLLVVLSHCGLQVDLQVAGLPGVDLIVGGHDQQLLDPPRRVDDVAILQAGEWGEYLGEVRLERRGEGWHLVSNTYHRVLAEGEPEAEVAAYVAGFRARLGDELKEVLTISTTELDGSEATIRGAESNFGDLVADRMREVTGADMALVNAGAIRRSLPAGPITVEDVLSAMPYENELVVLELSGAEIRELLKGSFTRSDRDGGFLQVSGLRVCGTQGGEVDLRGPEGGWDDQRLYRVAITEFLAGGGDGYASLAAEPAEETGHLLNGVVVEWLRDQERLTAATDGRLWRVAEATACGGLLGD